MLRSMDQLWNTEGLTPAEQAAHLARLRTSIRMAYEVLGANLQAVMAAAVTADLPALAEALGVPPAVAVRMATDPDCPDVALLLRGIKIVKRRHIPLDRADAIGYANQASHIIGETDGHIRRMAGLVVKIADLLPLEHEAWNDADADDRTTWVSAVTYARTLL